MVRFARKVKNYANSVDGDDMARAFDADAKVVRSHVWAK